MIHVITGHYGSGKTEFAVNLAIEFSKNHKHVILVDLDIVNPYFRSHDSAALLREKGIEVIAPAFAGTNVDIPVLPPEVMRIFEVPDAEVILDVGGDDDGAIALGRYKQYFDHTPYTMHFVVNTFRPLTQTVEEILDMKQNIEVASRLSVTSFVANCNIAEATEEKDVLSGTELVKKAAACAGLSVAYICAPQKIAAAHPDFFAITRYLKNF